MLTIIEDQYEDYCPDPREKSIILFKIEYIDGQEFGIEDYQYEGGGAEYEEIYGCGLDYILKEIVNVAEIKEQEWFVVEGFTLWFHTDYWGETDCDYEFDAIRPANIYDLLYFGEK